MVAPQPKATGYDVPKGEEGIFHVEMEPGGDRFDPRTGKKRFNTFIQKFHPADFALQVARNDRGIPQYVDVGYRINKILHRPGAEITDKIRVAAPKGKYITLTEALVGIDEIISKQQD